MTTHTTPSPFRFRLSGRREHEQDAFFEAALEQAGWVRDDDHWDTCWHTGMPERAVFRATSPTHTVNHIPGNNCLTIKDRLYDTIRGLQERIAVTRDPDDPAVARTQFVPVVYSMPDDYHTLQAAAQRDPDQLWLLKPKNSARGRDIRLLDDVAETPTDSRWMVQGYLHRPHLMDQRKYVLRLYVLITSIEPLRVYLYDQGFAKLASCEYTLDDRSNPYIHQTNPDVNARNADAESPVVFIDLERYGEWLRQQGHDDQALFARIRDLVALTMISAREPMRAATERFGADARGCYELIGLDVLVDDDLNPWLIECNLSPSMGVCASPEDGGTIEEAVKRQMVADVVSLVGLDQPDRVCAAPDDPAATLTAEADAEQARAGNFRRVVPAVDDPGQLQFFPFPRRADVILADHVAGRRVERPWAQPWHAAEIIHDGALTLYNDYSGALYSPNPAAALIWLRASEGDKPDAIARELAAASGLDTDDDDTLQPLEQQIWDALADWAWSRLLVQGMPTVTHPRPASIGDDTVDPDQDQTRVTLALQAGRMPTTVRISSHPAARHIQPLLAPMVSESDQPGACQLEIIRDRAGYALIAEGRVIAGSVPLAALGTTLAAYLLKSAADDGEIATPAALVGLDDDASALLVRRGDDAGDDALALALAAEMAQPVHGGVRLDIAESGLARGVGTPLRLRRDRDETLRTDNSVTTGGESARYATWSRDASGYLLSSASSRERSARRIETVIVHQPAADGESDEPRTLDVPTVLGVLLEQATRAGGHAVDGATATHLATWLSERRLLRSTDADPVRAAGRIIRLLDLQAGAHSTS